MVDDEVEIKIEYYDDYEVDPLGGTRDVSRNDAEEVKFDHVDPVCINEDSKQLKCAGDEVSDLEINELESNNEVECEGIDHGDSTDISNNESDRVECNDELQAHNVEITVHQTWFKEINETGKYACKFCTLSYLTVHSLRRHVLTKHPREGHNLKKEVIKNKRNSKFKCHICKSRFTEFVHLKEHMKKAHSVDDLKSFCHICRAMFDNDSLMSAHLLSEHKMCYTNVYICNTCGYRTWKASHFSQHRRIHSDEKSNKCKICDYATSNSSNLKIHERIHLNSKPYVCEYTGCDYKASARSALRSHLVKHNPEANMKYCDKCPYKTAYKQSLERHNSSHLKNTVKNVL